MSRRILMAAAITIIELIAWGGLAFVLAIAGWLILIDGLEAERLLRLTRNPPPKAVGTTMQAIQRTAPKSSDCIIHPDGRTATCEIIDKRGVRQYIHVAGRG